MYTGLHSGLSEYILGKSDCDTNLTACTYIKQGSHANLKSKFHDFSRTKLRFSMTIFYERGIQSQVWSIKLNTLNKVKVDNINLNFFEKSRWPALTATTMTKQTLIYTFTRERERK